MLDKLEQMATDLGMVFRYGEDSDLNNDADKHHVLDGYLLFHSGYLTADLNEDAQGALEYRHRLLLLICAPSALPDKPKDKRLIAEGLDLQLRRVYARLKKLGQISGARVELGLNLTDRNIDAIRLSLTLLTDAISLCRL